MTPAERLSRADRAKAAMVEFLEPAFTHVEQEWYEKLVHQAGQEDPKMAERIHRITTAIKSIRVVRAQIEAIVVDGAMAEAEIKRNAQVSQMSEHKRKTIGA